MVDPSLSAVRTGSEELKLRQAKEFEGYLFPIHLTFEISSFGHYFFKEKFFIFIPPFSGIQNWWIRR